jgi:alkanesulfonate monooxygenase SsuD/methylene tetrahydromethanopterin reductase-like flavin-dependent oxidoreductase (luciferase family)
VTDYGHGLRFGVFITPNATDAESIVKLALLADREGLDLVSFQDHPYQHRFLDAWTLLSVVAGQTESIRLAPNVANLPLRLPVLLARTAASLDILSEGRVHLGLGAGAFWDGIESVGGRRLTPGQSVDALGEAIDVIRAFWAPGDDPIEYEGEHYRVHGAKPGPVPASEVEIWVGAYKPRMLALTGTKADGWLVSAGGAPPDALGAMTAAIDAAAVEAGREPSAIRRMYNVGTEFGARDLAALHRDCGISTFILMTDDADAIRRFAHEIAPMVRELVP